MGEINKKEVGQRIRGIRASLGETAEKFGERFDPVANRGLVSAWENGRYLPNNERLVTIADIADISVDELLYGSIDERIHSVAGDLIAESNLPIESKQEAINKAKKQLEAINKRGDLNGQTIRTYIESELAGAEVLHALSGKVDVTQVRWLNPIDSKGYTTRDYIKALIYNVDLLIKQTEVQLKDFNKEELSKSIEYLLDCKKSLENQIK